MPLSYQEANDSLRETGYAESTVTVSGKEYRVTTTINKSKYRWYYSTHVVPNDFKLTAPEENLRAAPQHDEERWTAFLQDAAQRHVEKCHAILTHFQNLKRNQRRHIVIAAGLIVLAIAVAIFLQTGRRHGREPAAGVQPPVAVSADLKPGPVPTAVSPPQVHTPTRPEPASKRVAPPAPAAMSPAAPAGPDAAGIEALLTSPAGSPPPAAPANTAGAPEPGAAGRVPPALPPSAPAAPRAPPSAEEKIRCIILPSADCR